MPWCQVNLQWGIGLLERRCDFLSEEIFYGQTIDVFSPDYKITGHVVMTRRSVTVTFMGDLYARLTLANRGWGTIWSIHSANDASKICDGRLIPTCHSDGSIRIEQSVRLSLPGFDYAAGFSIRLRTRMLNGHWGIVHLKSRFRLLLMVISPSAHAYFPSSSGWWWSPLQNVSAYSFSRRPLLPTEYRKYSPVSSCILVSGIMAWWQNKQLPR